MQIFILGHIQQDSYIYPETLISVAVYNPVYILIYFERHINKSLAIHV